MAYSIDKAKPFVSFDVANAEKLVAQAFDSLGITTNAQRDSALSAPLQITINTLMVTFFKCFNLDS